MYGANIAIWALSNCSLTGKKPHERRVKLVICTCVLVKFSTYVVICLFQDQIVVNPEELYLTGSITILTQNNVDMKISTLFCEYSEDYFGNLQDCVKKDNLC